MTTIQTYSKRFIKKVPFNFGNIVAGNSGYSLIELMTVVAIFGIVGLIALPTLSPSGSRLRQAAREMYSNIQNTRLEAIKSSTDWAILFDTGTDSYSICSSDGGDGNWTNGNEVCAPAISLANYGSGIVFGFGEATVDVPTNVVNALNIVSYNNDTVIFDATGLVNTLGYVYIQNNKGSAFAVGTPTLAGTVVTLKWFNGSWR